MSTFAESVGRHMERMGGLDNRIEKVTIFPSGPNKDGWLEWILKYEFVDGGGLTVGAIQREPNATVEFHS